MQNQHSRELIRAQETPHKHNNKDLSHKLNKNNNLSFKKVGGEKKKDVLMVKKRKRKKDGSHLW